MFIGAPGGLEEERKSICEVMDSVNKEYALKKHTTLYIPVEWGKMTGGEGQPQNRINPEIEKCDYCLIIFWNYMGLGNTITEFEIGIECKNDRRPMKEVVVFFKRLSHGELKSQSDELKKVIEFKERIRTEHHFVEFNDLAELKKLIKEHLIDWLEPVEQILTRSSVTNFVDENMPES